MDEVSVGDAATIKPNCIGVADIEGAHGKIVAVTISGIPFGALIAGICRSVRSGIAAASLRRNAISGICSNSWTSAASLRHFFQDRCRNGAICYGVS